MLFFVWRLVNLVYTSGKNNTGDVLVNQISVNQIEQVKRLAIENASHDQSGHGVDHLQRVTKMIKLICKTENADQSIAVCAGWLHDVIDDKLTTEPQKQLQRVQEKLAEFGLSAPIIAAVVAIITNMSFAKTLTGKPHPLTMEGQIVQDADRLDAIGALGIARAFYYSGHFGEEMYDPQKKPRNHMTKEQYRHEPGTTINHFYEKLFKIYGLLNTETALQIGKQRQQIMQDFVHEFKSEWHSTVNQDGGGEPGDA